MQAHVQVLFKAGMLPMRTVGEPGVQGAGVTGIQGMGVRPPKAAVVAAATVGLARDVHIPNEGIFTIGLLSIIVAAGVPQKVLLVGNTLSAPGASPNGHINMAPETTSWGIVTPPSRSPFRPNCLLSKSFRLPVLLIILN